MQEGRFPHVVGIVAVSDGVLQQVTCSGVRIYMDYVLTSAQCAALGESGSIAVIDSQSVKNGGIQVIFMIIFTISALHIAYYVIFAF